MNPYNWGMRSLVGVSFIALAPFLFAELSHAAPANLTVAAIAIVPAVKPVSGEWMRTASSALPVKMDERLRACLPERLHPVSRMFLAAWLAGRISTPTFRRFFHMPNSDYLKVSECLVAVRRRIQAPGVKPGRA